MKISNKERLDIINEMLKDSEFLFHAVSGLCMLYRRAVINNFPDYWLRGITIHYICDTFPILKLIVPLTGGTFNKAHWWNLYNHNIRVKVLKILKFWYSFKLNILRIK